MKKLFLLCCFLPMMACRKKQDTHLEEPALRIWADTGIINGLTVFRAIGQEGAAHGLFNIQLAIPAGALLQTTGIGVASITNTLPGSPGKAFRIKPANITFRQPIMIVYTYSKTEKRDGPLYLAYQDDKGYWTIMNNTNMDTTMHTLTVTTTRTSDWTIYSKP